MNIDDLMDEFFNATGGVEIPTGTEGDIDIRAGVKAVVLALRDAMDDKGHYEIHLMFNDILGDAVEKAAGGGSGITKHPDATSPAADPVLHSPALGRFVQHKPAVPSQCEWEGGNWDWVSDCGVIQENPPLTPSCPSCGKPIKFKEPT